MVPMRPDDRRMRPGWTTEAHASRVGENSKLTSNSTPLRELPLSDAQAAVETVSGLFAVVVTTSEGRYRRRVWLTLAPAQRAAERAVEAGHVATVVLCRLEPIATVSDDASRWSA